MTLAYAEDMHEMVLGDARVRERGSLGAGAADAAVIARVLDGDVEAFGVLVDRYQNTFAAYATHMTGCVDDAADIIQESLVRAYRSLRRCKDPTNFKGWLFRIVSNQCKTHLGKRRRRQNVSLTAQEVPPARQRSDGEAEQQEQRRLIEVALQRLSHEQREALVLRYIDGLTIGEMATALAVTPSALKMRLLRGRAALRDQLEGLAR